MSDVASLIQSLGLTLKGESGDQLNVFCPGCDNGDARGDAHLYVNRETALFDCKRGCCKGNDYALVAFVKYGKTNARELDKDQKREAMALLAEHGLREARQPQGKKGKPTLTICDLAKSRKLTEDSLKRLGAIESEGELWFPMRNHKGELTGYRVRPARGKGYTRAPDGAKKGGKLSLLYPDDLDRAQPVVLCEGETSAACALDMGLNAMATSSYYLHPEHAYFFQGCTVILVPDLDTSGQDGADTIARKLWRIAKEIKIVRLPGEVQEKKGRDLRDYFQGGKTREEFDQLVSDTRPFELVGEPRAFDCPYREQNGGIVQKVQGPGGETVKPLTQNFTARIIGEVTEDDGIETRFQFEVEAKVKKDVKRVLLSSSDFGSMNWVLPNFGTQAFLYPGQGTKDHVRAAIQMLSGEVTRKTVYLHTGWRDLNEQWVYLHGNGAIGKDGVVPGIETRLPHDLQSYVLPEPPKGKRLKEAVKASLRILEVAPEQITFPCFAAVWRAAIQESNFSLFICGQSESGKSHLAALLQQHFGANWNAERFPSNWIATANVRETLAFLAKDTLFTIDDFCPTGSRSDVQRLHSEADRIFRGESNKSGRQRQTVDGSARAQRYPRGLILSTGEDLPNGYSLGKRLVVVYLSLDDINGKPLSACEQDGRAGLFAEAMAGFIQWLAQDYPTVKADSITQAEQFRAMLTASGKLSRTATNLANLATGMATFNTFARDIGALNDYETQELWDRFWNVLEGLEHTQSEHQTSADPVARFFELLNTALDSGNAHLANLNGAAPKKAEAYGWRSKGQCELTPMGDRIGWIEFPDGQEEGDLYLIPNAALNAAQKMARDTGEGLSITLGRLTKSIFERGLLKSRDDARRTHYVRQTVQGKRSSVMHLPSSVLEGVSPMSPNADQSDQSDQSIAPGHGSEPESGTEPTNPTNPTTDPTTTPQD